MPVGIANKAVGWTIEEWWLESWQEEENFVFLYTVRPVLGFIELSIQGFFVVANVAEARSCSCHVMLHLRLSVALRSFPVSLLGVHN